MKRAITSFLGLAAFVALGIGIAASPAQAVTIGVLPEGSAYADTIESNGPTFSEEYNFELTGSAQLTVLASALAQSSSSFGVDLLEIALFDSGHNLIASGSGAPIAFLDSFAQSGIPLGAGAYLFTIFGEVTAGKQAFVLISLAANSVVPIPAAGLLLLTGLGALGGIGAWRRRASA
jgi:hypothetical protein